MPAPGEVAREPSDERRRDEDGSSLDDVPEEDVERLEESVDTRSLDEEELVSLDDAARALLAKPPQGHGPIARLYRGETRFDFVGKRQIWFSISTAHHRAGDRLDRAARRAQPRDRVQGRDRVDHRRAGRHPDPGDRRPEGHRADRPDGRAARQREQADAQRAVRPEPAVAEPAGHGQHQRPEGAARAHRGGSPQDVADDHDLDDGRHHDHDDGQGGGRRGRVHDDDDLATSTVPQTPADKISITNVGPTWGSSITNKAIEALIIFFIVVAIYISIRFEPKMALAAFIAMIHDVLVAVGIYSIFNFQVTPDTVVAILTILGYSLYDTVVVFDRVRDNTKGIGSSGRLTYPQLINLSMNQTLARSINTSMVAILPVLAVLLIGAQLLGATTLQSYGLALFVGLLSGAYSSIFIASPVLCMMKEREDRWVQIANRLAKRGDAGGFYSALDAATMSTADERRRLRQVNRGGGGAPPRRSPAAASAAGRSGPVRAADRAAAAGPGPAVISRPAGSSASADVVDVSAGSADQRRCAGAPGTPPPQEQGQAQALS